MKAVDPVSLQVSVISSNTFLPEPKDNLTTDSEAQISQLKNSLNSSPVKDVPFQLSKSSVTSNGLVRKENGLESGDFFLNNKEDEINRSFVKENIPPTVTFCTNSVNINGTNGYIQNGEQKKELLKRDSETFTGSSLVNGGISNGYCEPDDECVTEKQSLESLTDAEAEEGRRSGSPPRDIPHPCNGICGLQADSGLESAASSWDRTVAEVKEHAVARLQEELRRARQELKLKDEEVVRLSRIRQEVESELEDLTASLFQEAHKMVRAANERQAAAEKAMRESYMQVEVLTAEVAALKTLVLTSTPSRPNPHLHPQIDPKAKEDTSSNGSALFRKHRRSPSHFNLKYGRENSPPESPVKELKAAPPAEPVELRDGVEVDPVMHKEFLTWKQNPTIEQTDPFISRIYREDIDSCLAFSNIELAREVRNAVESGNIYIEAVNEKSKTHFPKKCALLEAPRICQYRMRLGEVDLWHCISQICRNRYKYSAHETDQVSLEIRSSEDSLMKSMLTKPLVNLEPYLSLKAPLNSFPQIIAVCEFLNYLKYIQRGLVKSSTHDVYWEIMKLRKEMVLARLGLPLTT